MNQIRKVFQGVRQRLSCYQSPNVDRLLTCRAEALRSTSRGEGRYRRAEDKLTLYQSEAQSRGLSQRGRCINLYNEMAMLCQGPKILPMPVSFRYAKDAAGKVVGGHPSSSCRYALRSACGAKKNLIWLFTCLLMPSSISKHLVFKVACMET